MSPNRRPRCKGDTRTAALRAAGRVWGALVILAAAFSPLAAQAQARLEARYTASLAGLEIGKGAWVVDIGHDQFTAAATGLTTGLVRVFASGEGTGASRGALVGQHLVPASYAASLTTGKSSEEVRMTLAAGSVKDFSILPPPQLAPDRIPVTEAHRRNVLDPMTGSLVAVPGDGDLLTPDVCQRKLSIFDGRLRYDLAFAFKRVDQVKAAKGYEGPVLVCAVYFTPVAGYVPDRPAMKYLAAQKDMEIWLAPVDGTRVLVPFRFSVPTPIGTGVLQATLFQSTPLPPTKASAKTQ